MTTDILSLHRTILRNINLSINNADSVNKRTKLEKERLFFLSKTLHIINNYKKILKKPIIMSFTSSNASSNELIREKNELRAEYQNIISSYKMYYPKNTTIFVDDHNKTSVVMGCQQCGSTEIEDDVCLQCGLYIADTEDSVTSYCDSKRICINAKYKYNRIIHFKECMSQYQGKESVIVPSNVYALLEACFVNNHLVSKDKSVPKIIRYKKALKSHIYIFLKELNLSKYYDNINLIYSKLTGKQIPNIDHLETQILNDFKSFAAVYDRKIKEMPNVDKKKNTQYILYQLLHKHKYYCKASSFGIPKALKRNVFNDIITQSCFNELKWNIVKIE